VKIPRISIAQAKKRDNRYKRPACEPSFCDSDYKVVYFEGAKCVYDTDKAVLITTEDGEKESWFPKVAIYDDFTEVREIGDEGVFAVKWWFAEKEGLT